MVHEDYKELVAAKALTALDAEGTRELEGHLQTCAECRAELAEWEETAAFLALETNVSQPSADVRGRILAEVREAQNDLRSDSKQLSVKAEPVESEIPRRGANVLEFEAPRRSVFSFGSVGAIAAAIIFVALLASLILLWQQNRKTQAEMARMSTQMEEANSELARDRAALQLLTSPGARMAKLAGTKDAPDAQAMLAYDKAGHAMLMARGLPSAPKGMAYQLWFIKDGKKMPGKVFSTDAAGNGVLEDDIPNVALESAVFAVTLEPEGGVQVPTGAIYMVSGA